MNFHQKSLIYKNTTLYDIDFPQKIGFLRFFLRKFLLTVLHIFHRKYTPNFQKIDYCPYSFNILYIYNQNFMLVPTITTFYDIDFRIKMRNLWASFEIFWSIFWLFFFIVQSFTPNKFHQKSTFWYTPIYYIHCDQNFMLISTIKKLDFWDYFWESFYWRVFSHYLCRKYWLFFLLSKVSKMNFHQKSLIHKNTTLYDIDFPQKIGFFAIFFKKVSIDCFLHIFIEHIIFFIVQIFKKSNFSIYPNNIYIYDQTLYDIARSNNQTIRILR